MSGGNDTADARLSSSGFTSVEFDPGRTTVSTEDAAWADSCLIKDDEILEKGWDSVRDALVETLSNLPDTASCERENFPENYKMEISSSSESTGVFHNLDKATVSVTAKTEASEPISNDGLSFENSDVFWSRHNLKDVFLPTYSESLKDLGTFDPEEDLVLNSLELDRSDDEIFRTWDLDIPPVEGELVKQLNKALSQSSMEPDISVSDDFNASKDLDAPLHDLISGIKDLSLNPDVE